ncbi:hypothetical protein CLV28_1432 [Sediminihabitans luteus]|uniref:Excreted virulence factor EspC (Type VII ESX diderm) n=1 Tax=Sediminihabitans luteus TaxID=1138585 RepID=A0A2M9CQ28_9CELL|nr:hypothetical protein [Sediminihabitans luteus]PJJ73948.1 hypothetical protein CLV28_1432 [Sediminihabitans luteus]GII98139.1 hypothetical protein Slu03_05170 [Sediminihabitans luteus]
MPGDLRVSFDALTAAATQLTSFVGQLPDRARAWCDDTGSPAVTAAIDEWAFWYSTELLRVQDEVASAADQARYVVQEMSAADADLGRAAG